MTRSRNSPTEGIELLMKISRHSFFLLPSAYPAACLSTHHTAHLVHRQTLGHASPSPLGYTQKHLTLHQSHKKNHNKSHPSKIPSTYHIPFRKYRQHRLHPSHFQSIVGPIRHQTPNAFISPQCDNLTARGRGSYITCHIHTYKRIVAAYPPLTYIPHHHLSLYAKIAAYLETYVCIAMSLIHTSLSISIKQSKQQKKKKTTTLTHHLHPCIRPSAHPPNQQECSIKNPPRPAEISKKIQPSKHQPLDKTKASNE